MRKPLFQRLLPAILFFCACAFAQQAAAPTAQVSNPANISPPVATYKFPLNQTLRYAVDWRVFSAGSATLKMESAGREYRVVGTADASGAVAMLYHVRDRFESFFDPATFCSRTISKHTEEGFRRLDTNINFEGARGKAVLNEKNLKNNQSKTVENDIPPCVTDVVSSIFYMGSLPLEPNAVHYFPVNDGNKTITVKATVEAREEVKVPAGTFKTIRVQPSIESGKVKSSGQLWVWYSDDANRIPVQMKARMFWGTLTFRLERNDSAPAVSATPSK